MIDFEAVIRYFGPQAVALQLEEADKIDSKAVAALNSRSVPDRAEIVRHWLYNYQVFQGIHGPKRTAITEAVLLWADSQEGQSDLATFDALVSSHASLMAACSTADGRGRDFTSLASKALWLRYPDIVPMFDSFAQRALWVISKIEKDIAPPGEIRGHDTYPRSIFCVIFESFRFRNSSGDHQTGCPTNTRHGRTSRTTITS
jgi:predicted small secreted protein